MAGALCLLGGAVALVDHWLPGGRDPVLGSAVRDRLGWILGGALIVLGGASFWVGRRWGRRFDNS